MPAPVAFGRLSTRVFVAMSLVVVAGAGTLFLVALAIAPRVFHRHLLRAGIDLNGPVGHHAEEGFRTALLAAAIAGILAAILVAGLIALLGSRRLAEPIRLAAAAADRLAAGDYGVRLDSSSSGSELEQLAVAINSLAGRLESTEAARIRLFADLTHELRTPLTSILATVEAIDQGILPADARTLGVLDEQAKRLGRLIDDLNLVSRADEHAFRLQFEHVDLRAIAADAALAVTARGAAAGVHIEVLPGTPVAGLVDRDRIAEVVDQLLDNAIRSCGNCGTVTVEVVGLGSRSRMLVRDTGTGFEPATAEQLFVRFHRATSSSPGSGIGLTIARALVTAQGGTLTGTSQGPGTGATFTIELPAG